MPTKMPTVPLNDPYGIVRAADGFKILKTQATSFYDTVRTVPGIGGPSKSGAGGGSSFIDFKTGLAGLGTSGLPWVQQYKMRDWEYQNPGLGQFGADNWDELAAENKAAQDKLREQWANYLVDEEVRWQEAKQA